MRFDKIRRRGVPQDAMVLLKPKSQEHLAYEACRVLQAGEGTGPTHHSRLDNIHRRADTNSHKSCSKT